MSFSGLKSRVELLRYIPLEPMKYGPLLNMRSLSTLFSKRNTKKPLLERKCERLPLRCDFLFLSIEITIALGDGQMPVNWHMSACSTNFKVRALEVPWICIKGISSSFLTNFDEVFLYILGSEVVSVAKATTSLEESKGEGSRGPEASPGEGGMHAGEGRWSRRPQSDQIIRLLVY